MENKILKCVLIGTLTFAVSISFGQGIGKILKTNSDSVITGLIYIRRE